jgi:hypothetical protein
VLKEIIGVGGACQHLLVYDGLDTTFHKIKTRRDPACLCGPQASIRICGLRLVRVGCRAPLHGIVSRHAMTNATN